MPSLFAVLVAVLHLRIHVVALEPFHFPIDLLPGPRWRLADSHAAKYAPSQFCPAGGLPNQETG